MADITERIEDGVAVLTFNRPERRNAMNADIVATLLEALPRLAEDPDVGCVVLTGAGGAFCAGGDVKGFADAGAGGAAGGGTYDLAAQRLRHGMEISRWLHQMPKPTIASIPGAAAGAGLSMALACDLRIAAEGAKMTTAFRNVALAGDYGGSYFMTRLVGTARARELYYFGHVFLAEEALSMGLVNRVVPAGDLEKETMDWAQRLASGPRIALGYMKRNMNLAEQGRLDLSLDQEALFHSRTSFTEDFVEASTAFVEKRAPRFKGR